PRDLDLRRAGTVGLGAMRQDDRSSQKASDEQEHTCHPGCCSLLEGVHDCLLSDSPDRHGRATLHRAKCGPDFLKPGLPLNWVKFAAFARISRSSPLRKTQLLRLCVEVRKNCAH